MSRRLFKVQKLIDVYTKYERIYKIALPPYNFKHEIKYKKDWLHKK